MLLVTHGALTLLCGRQRCSLGHDGPLGLGSLLLRHGCGGQGLLLGLHNANVVRQGLLGADLTAGVPGQHDLHLDAQHA